MYLGTTWLASDENLNAGVNGNSKEHMHSNSMSIKPNNYLVGLRCIFCGLLYANVYSAGRVVDTEYDQAAMKGLKCGAAHGAAQSHTRPCIRGSPHVDRILCRCDV